MSLLGSPELKKVVLKISVRMSLNLFIPALEGAYYSIDFHRIRKHINEAKKEGFLKTCQNLSPILEKVSLINGFHFCTETNNFDKLWVRNSPYGSLKRGFNRIYLKKVIRFLFIWINMSKFPDSLSHIDYILKRN